MVKNAGVYTSRLTPRDHERVVKLVGGRCLLKCALENMETKLLNDNGGPSKYPFQVMAERKSDKCPYSEYF